jgi:hypothetical protein
MDTNMTLTLQNTTRSKDVLPTIHDESLVSDARGRMTPAEVIERKLSRLLQDTPVPLSHQTMTRRLGRQR